MNRRGRKKKQNTWPEPRPELHTTWSRSHGDQPVSPARGSFAFTNSGCNWYHKVSVCYVDCPTRNVSTQCVIVKLSPELRNALPVRRSSSSSSVASANRTLPDALTLALIAPHTLLYCESPKELRDWRLYTGVESTQKSGGLKLHERYISDSFSCCGPRGVWGSTSPHTGTYVHESSCPFHADFVVFILKPELTDQLKDVLTIPCLPSLDESHFSQALHSVNHYLSLIQRGPSGAAETYRILLKPPSPLSGNDLSIEDQMAAYNEMSRPQYTCGRSDSRAGAAVVYFDSNTPDNALVLAAMHLYSRRDDEIFTYCAISLPAIFHSIAGSRVCGVIPCLSLLVGACNNGHWSNRFYQDLQDCLHPRKDPEDKQRRYRWISQLLTVCDYLCRDEARAVMRLELTDSPQIVLDSLNLLSALLGCFEREVELEGVSRFHCQINRVFLTRASQRFYSGLERLFQRLYRHLTLSQSSDVIITVCVETWLKMCTLVGHKSSTFYEVAKFTRVKVLRDSPQFRDSANFQRLFGDLCLAFLTHTRMTAHEVVGSVESRTKVEELKREREALTAEVAGLRQELTQLEIETQGRCGVGESGGQLEIQTRGSCGIGERSGQLEIQTRGSCGIGERSGRLQSHIMSPSDSGTGGDIGDSGAGGDSGESGSGDSGDSGAGVRRVDSECPFWERDMNSLLAESKSLKDALGAAFHSMDEKSNGLWTHFVSHLETRLQENLSERLGPLLRGEGTSEGDRVELVVREWSSWEDVSVGLFYEVAEELGHGQSVRQVLSFQEQQEIVHLLDEHRNSTAKVI